MLRMFRRKRWRVIAALALSAIGLASLMLYLRGWRPVTIAKLALGQVRSRKGPPGRLVLDVRQAATATPVDVADTGDWPSYNRTLTSERYSPLSQINTESAGGLTVLCSYDTHVIENFESGLLMTGGALIGATGRDIFSIDPSNCRENWRTHEDFKLLGNRGAAYLDGRLFRGTQDGRVLAYDFKSGKRLWGATIANPRIGEAVDAAPVAWNGLVFIGNAGGDKKGVKGRMYALAADSGRIVWETYLIPKAASDPVRGPQGAMPASAISTWENTPDVPISGGATWTSYTLDPVTGRLYVPVANGVPDFPKHLREGVNLYTNSVLVLDAKTGGYIHHYPIDPGDWHDWDVSNTPSIVRTRGGRQLLSLAPKDGNLYGFDLAANRMLYRTPVTRIENAGAALSAAKDTHFCPGTLGGGEWNGVAYDPRTNLVFSGENEWCTTVRLLSDSEVKAVAEGQLWMGNAKAEPGDLFGKRDPIADWAGWVYATDADSGEWKWRLKSNYPVLSGLTPTGGGVVFFGDMGGNFYAVEASRGRRIWSRQLDGAVAGGVITYSVNGSQKVAVAAGGTSNIFLGKVVTAKVVILGLGGGGR